MGDSSSLLDNMPHFQQGVIYALSRFAIEMSDQIGRTRGSSEVDKNLDKAAGLLKYPGDIWVFDLSTSLMPTATSEKQYRAARRELLAYNQRLAAGAAVFDRRADNLLATVDRFAADLGSASATIDQHLSESGSPLVDFVVDDIFYRTKGRLYAYFAAESPWGGFRAGFEGTSGGHGLWPDADLVGGGGASRPADRRRRHAGRSVLPQPSGGAGLLSVAGAHPIA